MKKVYCLFLVLSFVLSACTQILPHPQTASLLKAEVTASQDFFDFFDASIYHEIVIEVNTAELNQLDKAMQDAFDQYGHYRISTYVKANFIYRENGIEKTRIDEIGLRTHGNIFSRYLIEYDGSTMNTLHWRLSFDETFDLEKDTKDYTIRKKRNLYGLDNLILKWNRTSVGTSNTTDPYITEAYGYQLYEEAGIPSSKASLVHVIFSIDGKEIDQGVMTMIEPIDETFIQKRSSEEANNGNLYKALWQNGPADLKSTNAALFGIKDEEANYFPAYDIKTNRADNKAKDLKTFIQTARTLLNKDLFNYLKKTLNYEAFISFNAMNYLFGNPDDFRYNNNNYYLYFDSSSQPRLTFMATDLDKGLGIVDWDPDGQAMKSVLPFDRFTSNGVLPIPELISRSFLSNYEPFRKDYLDTLKEQISTIFTYSKYLEAYQLAFDLYAKDVSKNATRTKPKTMGIPEGVQTYYCVQTFKVLNLKHPTTQCE